MNKIKKIVITGGPCAGKSKIIEEIVKKFGNRVIVIEETATKLLSIPYSEGGIGIPGKDLDWNEEWRDSFQEKIVHEQVAAEAEAEDLARIQNCNIILCDRGILDGSAYMQRGREELAEKFMLDIRKCQRQYHQVIHLNSVATDNPKLYEELKASNPCRFETTEEARELDQKIAEAWGDHERYHRIESCNSMEEKMTKFLEAVQIEDNSNENKTSENQETRENIQELNNQLKFTA